MAILILATLGAYFTGLFGAANGPSVTSASANLQTANVSQEVTFNAAVDNPRNVALSYQWDFGDGTNTSTTAAQATHAYTLPGRFIALLSVLDGGKVVTTNDNNLIYVDVNDPSVATQPAAGTSPPKPVALAGVDNNIPKPNTAVNFNGNASWQWVSSDNGQTWSISDTSDPTKFNVIKTYIWSFGDGSQDTTGNRTRAAVTQHTYQREGNFFSKLTAQNPNGTSAYGLTVRVTNFAGQGVRNPSVFNSVTFGEPQFLDPAVDYETAGGEILQNVYETALFFNGNSTTDLVPLLALEVPTLQNGGLSADGTTYNFKIRDGVKFHDASALTAEDVAFSWKRPLIIHDPEGPSWMMDLALYNYLLSNWLNLCGPNGDQACKASDYYAAQDAAGHPTPQWLKDALGTGMIDEQSVRKALDASIFVNTTAPQQSGVAGVVTVRLARPYPAFLKIAAYTVMDVVSKKYVEANRGDKWETQNDWMNRNAMGTGPFKLTAWRPNQVIILDRFDQYWRGAAKIQQVNIIKVQDITTRELMLFSGQADWAAIPRNHQNDVMQGGNARSGLQIVKDQPTFDVNFLGFNQKIAANPNDKFTNVPADFFAGGPGAGGWHVRRAFSYAFDYNAYLQNIVFGGGKQLQGPIPEGMFGFSRPNNLFTHDLEKAKAELAQTQAPGGGSWLDKGFKLTIYYNAGNLVREQGSLLLANGLKQVSPNIDIEVQALDWPVYLETVNHKQVPLFFLGWAPDYADPDDYVTPFLHSTAGFYSSRVGYANTTLDKLIEQAASEVDQTKRAQLYTQIQQTAIDDVPFLWVNQATSFSVQRSWVKGYVFNPMYSNLIYYDLSKG